MIKEIFDVEGPVIGFLDKAGQLIVLSGLWFLGCLPVITICTSNAALYYAVIKSLRRGQGSAVKEFWKCYRTNLGRGIPITAGVITCAALLALNLNILQGQGSSLLSAGAMIGTVLLSFFLIYVGPVLSRFQMGIADVVKLTFVMSIRFILYTLLLLCGTAALIAAQIFLLPIPTMLILPGLWYYLSTFLVEKALRAYMPCKDENDHAWYYEN